MKYKWRFNKWNSALVRECFQFLKIGIIFRTLWIKKRRDYFLSLLTRFVDLHSFNLLFSFHLCSLICTGSSRRMVKSCGNVFVFGKPASLQLAKTLGRWQYLINTIVCRTTCCFSRHGNFCIWENGIFGLPMVACVCGSRRFKQHRIGFSQLLIISFTIRKKYSTGK